MNIQIVLLLLSAVALNQAVARSLKLKELEQVSLEDLIRKHQNGNSNLAGSNDKSRRLAFLKKTSFSDIMPIPIPISFEPISERINPYLTTTTSLTPTAQSTTIVFTTPAPTTTPAPQTTQVPGSGSSLGITAPNAADLTNVINKIYQNYQNGTANQNMTNQISEALSQIANAVNHGLQSINVNLLNYANGSNAEQKLNDLNKLYQTTTAQYRAAFDASVAKYDSSALLVLQALGNLLSDAQGSVANNTNDALSILDTFRSTNLDDLQTYGNELVNGIINQNSQNFNKISANLDGQIGQLSSALASLTSQLPGSNSNGGSSSNGGHSPYNYYSNIPSNIYG